MKFAKFEDVYGKETYVNVERVNYVKDFAAGTTVISFGVDDTISVKMDPAQVLSRLFNAGKA